MAFAKIADNKQPLPIQIKGLEEAIYSVRIG
jgi:hypothetical protein